MPDGPAGQGPAAAGQTTGTGRFDIVLATINAKWIHPSLALRLLKANLGIYENRACILEFALRQPPAEKIDPILAARPRILGLSVSIWNHRASLELVKALDEVWGNPGSGYKRPVIIIGGPEVCHIPTECDMIRWADWVIRGDGEDIFRDLCELLLKKGAALSGSELSPVITSLPSIRRVEGKLIETYPADLLRIDPGYRLYTDEDLRQKLVYVEASRGCPFGCEFCLSSVEYGPRASRVREFSPEVFLAEMDRLIGRGARTFKFLDRTFNLDISRARRILEFFLERMEHPIEYPAEHPIKQLTAAARPEAPFCVHFEMVPSRFPPELRETLTRFPPGSLRLELGIQTLNPKTAALVNRPGDPERELEVIDFLRQHTNAIVHADLIAGLPGEDLASFAAGFDRLHLARPTEIQLGILKKLPGTPIGRHDEAWGMSYAPDPPYEVLATAALSARDLDRVKNFARFWELIVNRGAFVDLAPVLFPEGEPVFDRFMALADWLLARFGRNWGIDRRDLRTALEERAGTGRLLTEK
ncbi:MAG: DUF4080 domain-containing protein [Spirochaetaceae bacterium]|jgi:radical SAM superfamily enzyme YgiQ (UPF0313 family)|nr:DUF4080 domain-containing protein [Spirochaetaceae bacterium]